MNRSFFNVISRRLRQRGGRAAAAGGSAEQRPVKIRFGRRCFVHCSAMRKTVVIVPGYGLAVARAQHALKELTDKLVEKGIEVKYTADSPGGRHACRAT
ncbi:NAD(P)(+) transhydrogenase (Re/Si-specific) subunit beta [Paraburkholderia dipogonis]|uniref:NAD(P)(+) transhydrogenase (Re/Si-specific) subunit beta n=1 Tax=Paraburkholderia dipogonis TaxID=1211383 RepID=UPI0035E53DE5